MQDRPVTLRIPAGELLPDQALVLEASGVPRGSDVSLAVQEALASARLLFLETAKPVGMVVELSRDAFALVHEGDGLNAPDSVVGTLFPRAELLALFAVTVGEGTSLAIARSFEAHDYPVATLLDALASEAADRAAERLESLMEMTWKREGRLDQDGAALRYSPGYCGWHVTGQRALFRHLDPRRIGITLTDACLMDPVKSVSGVILAGPRSLHRFSPTRSFCAHCETHSCRERMRAILREPST